MFEEAMLLLEQPTPQVEELPRRIEALNICAFDVQSRITDLQDACSVIEEQATAEAATESNADKRKVKRCELLREDAEYNHQQAEIRNLERIRCCLQERSHRHARELRLYIAEKGAQL